MRFNRHNRTAFVLALSLILTASAIARIELSADARRVRIDVSDDAAATIDIAGDAIVPIRWTRGERTRATLPILLLPGPPTSSVDVSVAGESQAVAVDAATPRVAIDPASYAEPAPPAGRARWTALAVTAALTLLLASRVRPGRRGTIAVTLVAAGWTLGVLTFAATRPDVDRREVADRTWLRTRRPTIARLPWDGRQTPVIESAAHLRGLAPRFIVDADGHATLELTMSPGARVALRQ